VHFQSFAVFICVSISITAFPVLARILNETNLLTTTVGSTALGAAALDDVTAWSLLALSIALIHAGEGGNPIVVRTGRREGGREGGREGRRSEDGKP
jgi:Kef-type K+ transport system membrane component KefB